MVHMNTLILIVVAALTSASELAELLVPNVLQRSAAVGGGWSLALTSCPKDTTVACNYNGCCPSSLECGANGNVLSTFCCPKGTNCLSSIRATPFCADDSWSLWNSTVNTKGSATAGYFCCLSGQKGLQDKSCVVSDTIVVASLSAQLLSSGTGVAGAASTSSSIAATTSSVITTTTTTSAAATSSRVPSTSPTSTSGGNLLQLGKLAFGLGMLQVAAAILN